MHLRKVTELWEGGSTPAGQPAYALCFRQYTTCAQICLCQEAFLDFFPLTGHPLAYSRSLSLVLSAGAGAHARQTSSSLQ